jgi:lycopene cyclase domain-containing protein
MTYFAFLLRFLGIPIVILSIVAYLDHRQGRAIPGRLRHWPFAAAVGLLVVVVPIEEYTFFVVQTILAGLWMLFLMRRLRLDGPYPPLSARWRLVPVFLLTPVWLTSVVVLVSGWAPGTYLGLELAWALLPILIQIGFGGDILRRYGQLVLLSILGMTVYLCVSDFLAIGSGTWAISPGHSLNILIGGVLPFEEVVFFLLTNTLIAFGVVLVISQEGQARVREIGTRMRELLKSSA